MATVSQLRSVVRSNPKQSRDGARRLRRCVFLALLVAGAVTLGNVTSAAALPSKFYGFQFPYEKSPKNMKIVGRSGAEYFRVNFSPSMSHAEIEGIFDLAWQNGITILPDVYGGSEPVSNACAVGGNGWRELVQYLASFYGPGGHFWLTRPSNPRPVEAIEIWNEPNRGLNGADGIKAMPGETAYFVNRCAEAIHAVAPSTKVIMGGLLTVGSTGWVTDEDGKSRYNYTVHDFLQAALNLEPAVKYDGVGLHPYAFQPKGGEAIYERVGKNITAGREAVSAFISSGMPIWITELGWPSWGSDANHATVVEPERSYVLNDTFTWIENHQASYGIQSLVYYNYRDFGPGTSWDQRCGLLWQQPSNRGVDDNGNVLELPFSGALFSPSWATFKNHAGGDPFYPSVPNATSNGASFVTANGARLLGYYNPRGLQSEYQFEWGPTTSYGNFTPRRNAGFGDSGKDVVLPGEEKWGQPISGLSPNTTYHFRIVVRNENGETAYGADQAFTTKEPPVVTTKPATNVNQLDAVLNATVNPKEEVTDYYFEYGTSTAYGSNTPVTRAGYENVPVEVHDEIAGLQYGVTYHFRVVATSYLGTSKGEDKTFTTPYKGPAPAVSTRPASQVGDTGATLNGYVGPNGSETKIYFEYGPTAAYGSKTSEVSVGSGSATLSKSAAVTKLNPNVVHHYRIVAVNGSGTTLGADRTFLPGWTIQPSSKAAGILEDVSCVSATDCTAVGGAGKWAVAQHWDGSAWSEQAVAKPAGATSTTLLGISCTSSSACSAVGSYVDASSKTVTLAERWDGSEWKVQSAKSPSAAVAVLEDVSCAGVSECVAVGSYNASSVEKTLIERWNGTEWAIQTSKDPSASYSRLTSVSCPSSSFCMAVGFYEGPGSSWTPLTESWSSGGAWTQRTFEVPAGATKAWLYGVSCVSATVCTAVGDKEVYSGETRSEQTVAERWDGSAWLVQSTPNPASNSLDIADVSCTKSTACTAVGSYWEAPGVERPMAMGWDGTVWTMQSPPSTASDRKDRLHAVSCVISRGCEAVGFRITASEEILTFAEGYWRSAPPTVTTNAALSIGDNGATLNASVNPNGSETKYLFEYGTTSSYGSKTSEESAGSGTGSVEKGQAIGGLAPNTTYHYRVVATNENPDPAYGADQTFRSTGPPTPAIGAGVPDPATGKGATLNATINPNGHSTTYQFEYGTASGAYTTTVPAAPASAGSGTSGVPVSYGITGLNRNTKYYFRVSATSSSGKVASSEGSFTTQDAPGAETKPAFEVTSTGAKLSALVTTHGEATKYWFEYGATTSYGTKVPTLPKSLSAEQASASVEQAVTGLLGTTVYHYRVVAENPLGTAFGSDVAFTTSNPVGTLKAEQYPAALTGSQTVNSVLKITAGSSDCTTTNMTGTVSGDTQEWAVTPSYSGCTCIGVACTVDPNGCTYKLKITSETTGTVDISCPGSNTITFTNSKCVIHLGSQTGIGTVTYSNSGSGTTREVNFAFNLSGLKYIHTAGTGIGKCSTGSGMAGTLSGTWRMTGESDPGSSHVGLFVQ